MTQLISCYLNHAAVSDKTFSVPYTPYDYPLKKKLGDKVFAEVSLLSEDEDLKVSIKKCLATTGLNDNIVTKEYVFINDGYDRHRKFYIRNFVNTLRHLQLQSRPNNDNVKQQCAQTTTARPFFHRDFPFHR